ncbi:TonB-dependent receptor [Phenylobacterium sp. 20VBR1]|uniref:TonB-dependent receptor n=1 Tax=Phenylobacterium glaciei TaxID=2803784 RepID=A0A941HVI7_9CAUL|nr:TonB-dependent receptor [Phenylobacterium glaciei]MBR7619111.1 TonB-dependent receptor [Phenylobacterium glaciei]
MAVSNRRRKPWGLVALCLGLGGLSPSAARAQTAEVGEVVVTGFRASLASAIEIKKRETALVDVINAEDIADFPDLNLAEALQRIPGVAIDRDGGEGRSITVRGLSGDFSRVRLNGLEALATTGGKDSAGGANRGRSFDFQVFASELFSRVTVRKTQSAEVEEGSLGATVDLTTAKPFDQKGFTFAGGVQGGYNDLSRTVDPRVTAMISDTWLDGRLGALLSVAYSTRHILEEGASSGRWENPSVPTNSAGCFQTPGPCNSPVGVYSAVNSAWHARIPRYGRLAYDWRRYGVTAAVQFLASDTTALDIDAAYASMDGVRDEAYLGAFSLWHGGAGNSQTDVRDPFIDSRNQLVKATFDDVDVRSESRHDELSSTFRQVSVRLDHDFNERLNVGIVLGQSRSIQDNPVQTTVSIDRYDQDGYGYDFSNSQKLPALTYGFDVTDPGNWIVSPSSALGDASFLRMRPNKTVNGFTNLSVAARFKVNEGLSLKSGLLFKTYRFRTTEARRYVVGGLVDGAVALPGVDVAAISTPITGFGRGLGAPSDTPTTWLSPNVAQVANLIDLYCNCVNAYGDFRVSAENQRGGNRQVEERDLGVYLQLDFESRLFGIPVRGDVGVRHAATTSMAAGFVGASYVSISRKYDDSLPALNLVLEPRQDLQIRLSVAKAMARPQLPFLTPGGTISNTARTLTIGNPLLEPVRATTYDLGLEWYPARAALVSVGVFRKDLQSYIQSSAATMAYGATGLPASLLANGNTPDTVFLVTQLLNTAGGELKGFEVGAQGAFEFLPAPFDRFGAIANYTQVDSKVTYITNSAASPPTTSVLPLVGLSPKSWNATLYYEGERLSARVSTAYRDGYLSLVPGGNGNDARGKNPTLNVDVSLTYKLNERFSLSFEGINLTDQFEDRWISTERRNSEEYTHTGRQFFVGARVRL